MITISFSLLSVSLKPLSFDGCFVSPRLNESLKRNLVRLNRNELVARLSKWIYLIIISSLFFRWVAYYPSNLDNYCLDLTRMEAVKAIIIIVKIQKAVHLFLSHLPLAGEFAHRILYSNTFFQQPGFQPPSEKSPAISPSIIRTFVLYMSWKYAPFRILPHHGNHGAMLYPQFKDNLPVILIKED